MGTDSGSNDGRIELPTDFAEHAAVVSGLDDPPETLEEWWTILYEQFSASGETIEAENMYKGSRTRHEVHLNDRTRYALCAVDALAAAALEEQDVVSIHSTDPVTDDVVTFVVGDGSVHVTPEEAVVSFGMAPDAIEVEASDGSFIASLSQEEPSVREASFCQYINAFENEASYEQWASDTDGITIPLPAEKAGSLVRRLVRTQD